MDEPVINRMRSGRVVVGNASPQIFRDPLQTGGASLLPLFPTATVAQNAPVATSLVAQDYGGTGTSFAIGSTVIIVSNWLGSMPGNSYAFGGFSGPGGWTFVWTLDGAGVPADALVYGPFIILWGNGSYDFTGTWEVSATNLYGSANQSVDLTFS